MLPHCAGIGLRALHYRDFLAARQPVGWLEVHSENYFGAGGYDLHVLERVRRDYPISLHGVGLGIGSALGWDSEHLERLAALAECIQPAVVSEHLCWTSVEGMSLNDLLPLPYTHEALRHVASRIVEAQDADALTEQWTSAAADIQKTKIAPKKTDIDVQMVALAWAPTWEVTYEDNDVEVLGMPADSDWVLCAPNQFDRNYLHNPMAMAMGRQMGHYASRTRFAEYGNRFA